MTFKFHLAAKFWTLFSRAVPCVCLPRPLLDGLELVVQKLSGDEALDSSRALSVLTLCLGEISEFSSGVTERPDIADPLREKLWPLLERVVREPFRRWTADKMADHLIGVAREQIRRWPLHDTGIEINDDIAGNRGPVFSPKSFELIFLPAYRRMVREYKAAGASYVMFHSDGNIMPLLDMLVDAGIDAINPMERRAGMDTSAIRDRYPRLVLTGGMCNTDTLVNGPVERIERETRELIDLGRDGGLVIGSHSIGPEVPLDHFRAYDRTCRTYGNFR